MNKLNNSNFFYCYSPVLFKFLQNKGFRYICCGMAENTGKKFWQFERCEELSAALDEFKNTKPQN